MNLRYSGNVSLYSDLCVNLSMFNWTFLFTGSQFNWKQNQLNPNKNSQRIASIGHSETAQGTRASSVTVNWHKHLKYRYILHADMPVNVRVSLRRRYIYLLVRETIWRVSIWHTDMKYIPKDHIESCHLTKFDTFRVNRDQVTDLETQTRGSKSIQTYLMLRQRPWFLGLEMGKLTWFFISASFKWWVNDGIFQLSQTYKTFFKRLYGSGGCCRNIRYVCMDLEPCFKIHNLVYLS